ncbi:MAG: flagellar basal body P-ring formation chaperone FlgA [Phycisphaerae bacterium]
MQSKDCDKLVINVWGPRRWAAVGTLLLAVGTASADDLGRVRLWPEAVVVGKTITVGDLCALTGFDAAAHERLRKVELADAPQPGGSKVVTLAALRQGLERAGINMARTIVHGSAECGVRRPRSVPATLGNPHVKPGEGDAVPTDHPNGLRQAAEAFFQRELQNYPGRVEVDFDRRSEAVLELAGQEFEFDVRRRSGRSLGMIDIQVDILRRGERVQTVELRPIVRLVRRIVIARRPINQKAQVRPEEVELSERTFERLERLGITDLNAVVTQRAKRFIPAGSILQAGDLESVPLVNRGQLVDVVSRSGGITVVTVAKAMQAGGLGDVVELRGGQGRKGRRLVGVVVGPRRVEIRGEALAMGGPNAGAGRPSR